MPKRLPEELLAACVPTPEPESFIDTLAKFGPLLISIIAVGFCFYIYKKVLDLTNSKSEELFSNYIKEQNILNNRLGNSLKVITEQVNQLSSIIQQNNIKTANIETNISPSISHDNIDTFIAKIEDHSEEDQVSEKSISVEKKKVKKSKKLENQ